MLREAALGRFWRCSPRAVTLASLLWLGCHDDDATPSAVDSACRPPNRTVGDVCLEPGVADDGCPAGTLGQPDGSCRRPAMLPEDCGEGFAHRPFDVASGDVLSGAGSCEPVLPVEPCAEARIAVPGDAACRAVRDCGTGKWGDIPVDGSTIYVDATFVGVSDGSASAPFTSVGDSLFLRGSR